MRYDCVIIGGGPAGMSAALVLGRAKLNVLLIDDDSPRNKVTHESHGFITNDSLSPVEIREKAKNDVSKYPTIQLRLDTVTDVTASDSYFTIETPEENVEAIRIIIATGLKETLPDIEGVHSAYGDLFFNCPFCDGWEMRDKKLAVIAEKEEHILHFAQMIFHWSSNILVFTNGRKVSDTIKSTLAKNKIDLFEENIESIRKENQRCEISLVNSQVVEVEGGFLAPHFDSNLLFAQNLSLAVDSRGRIQTDEVGKTSYQNVYAAGDINELFGEQLVHAASSGSKVAAAIVKEIASENFISDK